MLRIFAWVVILGFFTAASAATARDREGETPSSETGNEPAAKSNDSAKPEVRKGEKITVESDLQELRDLVRSQTEEIHELRTCLAVIEARAAVSRDTTASLAGIIQPAAPAATPDVSILATAAKQDAAGGPNESKSPLSFKIGSAEFTPGGFLDMTSFFRSTNVGSGIATSFGSIPFSNQLPQGGLTETHFSAQYSRLSLKVDTHLTDSTDLTGYVETDFLGYLPANAYQTANSNSLRLRVYWADVRHGKWEVLAGQEWSLLTSNRVGLSPLTQDIFYTLDEDPNFQVGLTWARQAQVRVVYHPTGNWAVGLSLENPQQFAPGSVVYPSTFFSSQFDNGSGSTSAASSATNTAVPNLHPDIIVKTAFDAHPAGHSLHTWRAAPVPPNACLAESRSRSPP